MIVNFLRTEFVFFLYFLYFYFNLSDPTPESARLNFNWNSSSTGELDHLSVTDSPSMRVGFRWQAHIFWNKYGVYFLIFLIQNLRKTFCPQKFADKKFADKIFADKIFLSPPLGFCGCRKYAKNNFIG